MHYIFKGAEIGRPGLIAGLQENPTQLERIVNGFGWSLDRDDVHVMYRSPVDMYLDEWVYELLATVEERGIRRILIDSLGDLRATATDEIRFREYVYSLLQRTAHAGIGVFMTQEVAELFGVTRLSEYGISHLSDNVAPPAVPAGRVPDQARAHGAEDPREQPRSPHPGVRDHVERDRARRAVRRRSVVGVAGARPSGSQ